MTITLKTLSCFIAVAAILVATTTSTASNRPAASVRSIGPTELEMQVLLDRANFSSGELDGKGGKNSREALAAFQTARGLAPGARGRNALLLALGAGTVKPIVSYTITAKDAAGPFNKTRTWTGTWKGCGRERGSSVGMSSVLWDRREMRMRAPRTCILQSSN